MAMAMQQISPVAHWPLVLGVVRKLQGAAVIDTFCPPPPAPVLSCGRGVEALLLAILDGHQALYKVGARLEERGMLSRLQAGLPSTALNDDRLGQSLDALFAANLYRVLGAVALQALAVYALPPPGSIRLPRRSRCLAPMRRSAAWGPVQCPHVRPGSFSFRRGIA